LWRISASSSFLCARGHPAPASSTTAEKHIPDGVDCPLMLGNNPSELCDPMITGFNPADKP
jgi:hypothetical protein